MPRKPAMVISSWIWRSYGGHGVLRLARSTGLEDAILDQTGDPLEKVFGTGVDDGVSPRVSVVWRDRVLEQVLPAFPCGDDIVGFCSRHRVA